MPIIGAPDQTISQANPVTRVAIIGSDYVGMKPTMLVQEGDKVKLGQPIFSGKKNPGVVYTSPASGTVEKINRGAKRVLLSVVIKIEGDDAVEFEKIDSKDIPNADGDKIRSILIESGMWTAIRQRPYVKIPAVDDVPDAIFVNAMDTNPLAGDPSVIIKESAQCYQNGLHALSRLTEGKVYVCNGEKSDSHFVENPKLISARFSGPHPAGLSGTHIHNIYPVNLERKVWQIGYQDVIAIGELLRTGKLSTDRVISLAGPVVNKPRLVKTRLGASMDELVAGELSEKEVRMISGSVLSGRTSFDMVAYLGRYDNQISVIAEGGKREVLGWVAPAPHKYSFLNVLVSAFNRSKKFSMNSMQNGSPRAMVPLGYYERVMPLDMLPTQLLRALVVGDTDNAQALGCLELDAEDLALCSFVSSSKYDYGPVLRARLEQIEKEG